MNNANDTLMERPPDNDHHHQHHHQWHHEMIDAIAQTEDGQFVIDGTMTIRDLNRANDWALPDTEANTIAGLVIHEAQTIPIIGQVFSFHGFRFEVSGRIANRITELKIRPL